MTPKATLYPKLVRAMTNLQVSYSIDSNVEQAEQEKAMKENLIFSTDLATMAIAEDITPMKKEPQTFNEGWNHHNPKS